MPVTHGVAGSSPVQTAILEEAFLNGKAFFIIIKSSFMFYVYIIYSKTFDVYYKGFSENSLKDYCIIMRIKVNILLKKVHGS